MFKRLPEAATTPEHAGKHHLHQWLTDVSPTTVRAARRTWLPALGLALIVSTTLLACGSDETQQQSDSDRPASAQEATEPTSRSTPTTSSGTQPARDDNDHRSTPAARETREPESATETPEPTAAPTNTPAPTPTHTPAPTPTPTPEPHHEFAQFMAPFNQKGDPIHRMPDDGTDEPIYPFNHVRFGGTFDGNYTQYGNQRYLVEGELKYPELAADIRQQALWEIENPSAEQIRQQLTDEEKAAGVPTDNRVLPHHLHHQMQNRAEWQLVSSTPEDITISIVTYFTHPWAELRRGQEPIVQFRIMGTAVIKRVNPAESQNGAIYRLKDTHDQVPEFSHLVGEPVVEKQ